MSKSLKSVVSLALAGAAATVVVTSARPAHATDVVCNVNQVGFYDYGAQGTEFMNLQCNAQWYGASVSGGCGPKSVDTIKLWANLAQAALLSGKPLYITYVGGNCLTYVSLML